MNALVFSILLAAQTTPAAARPVAQSHAFSVVEATIPQMQQALASGRVTSVELVRQYLARIATYEPVLHAVLYVNPRALQEAGRLDRERAAGHIRGPLHGIPVALKDNIHTTMMPTTGGALAFAGMVPPYEATLTANLRAAGAIIIAKTGMTELANWVAGDPTPMPTNYNSLGGFGFNPFDPRRDPRDETFDGRPALQTGGSSSGIGTNASFWAANVGTETSGSILSPSNQNMLAGIKPTVGRISRYGVIPITADQDTPGPMARTVTDAAIMLGVLEGKTPDPHDPATNTCPPPPGHSYTRYLRAGGLKGARIGVPRAVFYDHLTPEQQISMANALTALKSKGAVVVDPANIPSVVDPNPGNNFTRWNICSGADNARGRDADCAVGLKYGMKRDFNAWLASLGTASPIKTLTELREWNLKHAKAGTLKYGQSNLDISDEMDVERDRARYQADRAKDVRLAGTHGIDEVMQAEHLDALLFPGPAGAGISARVGYPTVIVPFALVPNAPSSRFPEGFDARPAPFGVSFAGRACSEARLIELAYAFERATKRRVAPPGFR
ncbi:MAG TPA: amidase family protein [Vicinamibacterales bacterium]|nr:amidase family protein [Vicinamibacterales bacterium]